LIRHEVAKCYHPVNEAHSSEMACQPKLGERRLESLAGIAPASWWPCASTFANRRLNCSANGIEIENAGGSFHPRLRCYLILASSNRSLCGSPLGPNKVRDYGWHGRVEADYVQHAAVVRVGEGEAVGGHAHNDRLRVTDELAAILTQCLPRVDVARPRFAVRVGDKSRHIELVLAC